MRKKLLITLFAAAFLCLTLCAFQIDKNSSLKSLTKPYINTYECVFMRLGDEDMLKDFDYIKLTLSDGENLELNYKKRGGKQRKYRGKYELDENTRELTCDVGVLGYRYTQPAQIVNGRIIVKKVISEKPFVAIFKC